MSAYKHITTEEKEMIAIRRQAGWSMSAIGRELDRPASAISRELRRNSLASGHYSPRLADGAYLERRQRAARLERDETLRQYVTDRLAEGWSPEQIAGWLKAGNEPGLAAPCTETIYAFIYRARQKADELWRYLARRRKKRKPLKARGKRETIKDRTPIHERPEAVGERKEVGHWEGDLIICKRTKPILVLHERKTQVTLAARLCGKTAAETIAAMLAVLKRLDPSLRHSMTLDNGPEFALHTLLRKALGMKTWFCDPYASWQKGGIENANGRLRRWLPRWRDPDKIPDEELQEIVLPTNLTPRKCLGFKTPFQALGEALGRQVVLRFA